VPRFLVGTMEPVPIKCICMALGWVVGRCDGGSRGVEEVGGGGVGGGVVVVVVVVKYCERMGGVGRANRAVWSLLIAGRNILVL
jgi:hypothetical protein